MSSTVHYAGTLTPIEPSEPDLEYTARKLLDSMGVKRDSDYSCVDQLMEETPPGAYLVLNGTLFIADTEEYDSDSFSDINILPDGKIEFRVIYYDGGASIEEVLEYGIDRLDKAKDQS